MPRPKKEQPNHAGGLYEVKITIGKTLEGKLLRKSFYSPSSKEDARRQAEQYKIEQEAARLVGEPFITKDITLEDWAAQWLAKYKKDTVRAYTYQCTYDSTIRKHIIPKLGKAPLSAILPSFLYFKSPNIPVPNNGFPHTRQYLSLLSTGDKQFM